MNKPELPKVGIVVVNYNSYDDTSRCLHSLLQLQYSSYSIYCVDNASSDGSLAKLQNEFSAEPIHLIASKINLGFAGGCNLGAKAGLDDGADFIWLVNSDATVKSDSLAQLVAAMNELPRVAAAGSKILFGETAAEPTIWSGGGRIDFNIKQIAMEGYGEFDKGQHDKIKSCDYLPGCSLLIRRQALEEVGFLPEKYFMYFEETDWCVRAAKQYGPLLYVGQSVVWHHFAKDKPQTPFVVYYYNRNSLLFWLTFADTPSDWIRLVVSSVRSLLNSAYAYYKAPTLELRQIFRSHVMANLHFLIGKSGRYQGL